MILNRCSCFTISVFTLDVNFYGRPPSCIWKLHYFLCYISTVKEVQHSPASFEVVGSTKPKTSYSDNRYQGSYQLLSVLSLEFSFRLIKNGCLMISMSAGYSSQRHYIKFYKEHKVLFIIHLIHCNYIRPSSSK